MKPLIALMAVTYLVTLIGCGGPQPTVDDPAAAPTNDPAAVATEPPPAADPPTKIEASYEFGAWGPCDKQRLVYTRDGDNYSYARICDDNQTQNTEVITAEQFRQAVFIEDYKASIGRPLAELPAAEWPVQCGECTKCYKSADEVATVCQSSAGVVVYSLSNPAALGKTDSNKTRWLIEYSEE